MSKNETMRTYLFIEGGLGMAGPNENPSRKYAYLEQLSTERLEELLTLDSDPSSDQEDEELIDAIMEVILRRESEHPTGRLTDVDKAWEDFQKYYNTPEGEGLSLYPDEDVGAERPDIHIQDPTPITPRIKHNRLKRLLLSAAIVACLIVFGLPPAMGYTSFFEMIGQWTESIFHFAPQGGETNPSHLGTDKSALSGKYDTLQEALEAFGITEDVVPAWIPENFTTNGAVTNYSPDFGETEISALYEDNGERLISILILDRELSEARTYEKNGNPVIQFHTGDVTHYIFENGEKYTATWYVGTLECSIVTNLSLDDLQKMIESIYER